MRILIVGGGVAAHGAVNGLRAAGYRGDIVLLGKEAEPPYERPPLSKRYLLETMQHPDLHLRPLDCELRLGQEVIELEPDGHRLRLASGEQMSYDRLLLATGGRARPLPSHPDALTLREAGDADRLRAGLATGEPLTIAGAGFIGCEVAAAARTLQVPTTVYGREAQPMNRVLGPELGRYLAQLHRSRGVDLHTGMTAPPNLEGTVLAATGSQPNTELAEAAGIACDSGILVDELGRTSAPDIFAAGDCARFWSPSFEAHVRVEHFQTANRHGSATGKAMAGQGQPFLQAPWFWSDQYDLNLQYVGAGLAWDEMVVRGELGRPPFTAFQLKQGQLMAAIGFNDGRTIAQARRLLETRAEISAEQLADPGSDLRAYAKPPESKRPPYSYGKHD
jgi:3-phenylpropionate/trans-cinnamate dioxygenase ferredoxin reductase component